ncbi:MAG: hypothetical protein ACW96N_02360, partial [Candidatus Thorarchaeota archaeon]
SLVRSSTKRVSILSVRYIVAAFEFMSEGQCVGVDGGEIRRGHSNGMACHFITSQMTEVQERIYPFDSCNRDINHKGRPVKIESSPPI